MDDERDRKETLREPANDNAHLLEAMRRGEETCCAAGEDLDRLVIDIARLIGRRMAREDHAARTAANDNGEDRGDRDEPDAE